LVETVPLGFGRLPPLLDFFDALPEKCIKILRCLGIQGLEISDLLLFLGIHALVIHFLGGHIEALLPQSFWCL
jgi:hypothetical protein